MHSAADEAQGVWAGSFGLPFNQTPHLMQLIFSTKQGPSKIEWESQSEQQVESDRLGNASVV
jgi:hypothetical protein